MPAEGEMIYNEIEERYVGEMLNGVQQGEGMMQFYNGEIYTGSWHDGLMHGQGLYSYPDGAEYMGSFVEGMKT